MGKEQPQPHDPLGFTENERLFYRVTHRRFHQIIDDERTDVHRMELSTNSFGEFLFVTLSKSSEPVRQPITFYGLGFHDYRERWIHQEWYWYQANSHAATTAHVIDKDEAREMLETREREIAPYVDEETQTRRGQLFEMLADLTDEDGALTDLEDLGDWFDEQL